MLCSKTLDAPECVKEKFEAAGLMYSRAWAGMTFG
jgi:hypothetical protein